MRSRGVAPVLRELTRLVHNTAPLELARQVYGPGTDPGYLEEKAELIRRDFVTWVGSLDSIRLEALAELVRRRL